MEEFDIAAYPAVFKQWLEYLGRGLNVSEQTRGLLEKDEPVPVEFRVVAVDGNHGPIVHEYIEQTVETIVLGRFDWDGATDVPPGVASVRTATRLEVEVHYPDFYLPLASQLTLQHYRDYLLNYLKTHEHLKGKPNEIEGGWSLKGVLPAVRPLTALESVRAEISNAAGMVESLIVAIAPQQRSLEQWPIYVAQQINHRMARVRVGEWRSGGELDVDGFVPLGSSTQLPLWLSEKEEGLTFQLSFVPRWISVSNTVPLTPLNTEKNIQLVVHEGEGARTLAVRIPEAYKDDWHRYLAIYINHRRWGIACGSMDRDGLVTPQGAGENDWYVLNGSLIDAVEAQVVPLAASDWPLGTEQPLPSRSLRNDVSLLNMWDALTQMPTCHADIHVYLDNLLRRCLEAAGVSAEDRSRVRAASPLVFRFRFAAGVNTLGYVPFSATHYEVHTALQVALGEHERRASIWDRQDSVTSPGGEVTPAVIETLARLSDRLQQVFNADLARLSSSAPFCAAYDMACEALMSGRLITWLNAIDDERMSSYKSLATDFLDGKLNARLVVRDGHVIANLFALSRRPGKALIISVAPGPSSVAGWVKDGLIVTRGESFDDFLRRHLSLSVRSAQFHDAKNAEVVNEIDLHFRESSDCAGELRFAALELAKDDINYMIFTRDEREVRDRLLLAQGSVRTLLGIVNTLIAPYASFGVLLAVGVINVLGGVSAALLNLLRARTADRRADYDRYLQDGKLGALFLLVETGGAWPGPGIAVRRAIGNVARASRQMTHARPSLASTDMISDWTDPRCSESGRTMDFQFMSVNDSFTDTRALIQNAIRSSSQASWFGVMLGAPADNSYEAVQRALVILSAQGWITRVVGVLRFPTPASVRPDRHYVLQIGAGSQALVIDFTGQQFAQWPIPKAFAGATEDWERYFTTLDKNLGAILLSAVFDSLEAAARGLGRLSNGGVQHGVFIEENDYRVLQCPMLWGPQLERQMLRLWGAVTQGGATSAERDTLYRQMSNVDVLHIPSEQKLRRLIGRTAPAQLRGFVFQQPGGATATPEVLRSQERVLIEQECACVESIVERLDNLHQVTGRQIASPTQRVERALRWIVDASRVPAGFDPRKVRTQLQLYVEGWYKNSNLLDVRTIDDLHDVLIKPYVFNATQVRPAGGFPTGICARALFLRYLGRDELFSVEAVGERLFVLMVRCNFYFAGNDLLGRFLYAAHYLRQGDIVIPTAEDEFSLTGMRLSATPQPNPG